MDEYIALGLANNSGVQAARLNVEAASWQVPASGTLDDPVLSVSALPAPIETANGPQNVAIGVSQKIPIAEKRRQQRAIAHAAADEALATLAAAERELTARIRAAFAELLYRQQALEVIRAEKQLLSDLTKITIDRYRAKQVDQQDVAQAELAELQIVQELVSAEQALSSAQTAMARLLQFAPDTPLSATPEDSLEQLSLDVHLLLDQAVASQPELQVLIARANQHQLQADLAQLDYVPDPTVGASWIGIGDGGSSPVANGEDAVLLNVSMNLPLNHRRIEAKIRSAAAKAHSSMRLYDDQRSETSREVYEAYTEIQTTHELIELLQTEIIPKATETLEVTVNAYRVSRTDIQQVLENWRKPFRYELSLRQLEMEYRKSLARLERAVGVCLPTCDDGQLERLPEPSQNSSQAAVSPMWPWYD